MNKVYYVNTLQVGEELTDFFMAKSPSVKVGSNHKNYFDITLCDRTGEVNGKKWDVDDVEGANLGKLKDGDLVKIKASVSEWNGIKISYGQEIRIPAGQKSPAGICFERQKW